MGWRDTIAMVDEEKEVTKVRFARSALELVAPVADVCFDADCGRQGGQGDEEVVLLAPQRIQVVDLPGVSSPSTLGPGIGLISIRWLTIGTVHQIRRCGQAGC